MLYYGKTSNFNCLPYSFFNSAGRFSDKVYEKLIYSIPICLILSAVYADYACFQMKRNLYSKLSGEHALLMNHDAVNVDDILTAICVDK